MEQSQLSSLIAMLKVAYPRNFERYENPENENEFIAFVQMFKHQLGMYEYEVVFKAIDEIVSYSRFFPTFAELKSACKKWRKNYYMSIIENSGEIDDKKFLISMVDWYSLSDKYSEDILKRISELKNQLPGFNQKYLE